MAKDYNPRSGSSDSRNRRPPQAGRSFAKSRRSKPARPPLAPNRSRVEYTQSAKDDLAAQTPQSDPRMRYARFRSDKTTRVLGDPREARRASRHQIDGMPLGTGSFSGGIGGHAGRGAHGRRGAAGITVREHREHQRLARRRESKLPGRIAIAVVALIVLVAGAFLIYQSPLFTVQEVRVEGAQRLTDERLTELAAIPEGSTLLRLDTEGMTKRLEADPWVASVEIKRSFPSTVLLTVKEREIAATVEVPAARSGEPAQQWFVSKDGRWLGFFAPTPPGTESATPGTNGQEAATTEGAAEGQDGERQAAEGAEGTEGGGEGAADAGAQGTNQGADANAQPGTSQTQAASEPPDEPSILVGVRVTASELGQLIPIRDVPQSLAPKIGEAVTDEGVLNALDIINTVTPEMRSLIRSISALDRVKTMLTLTNNVEVAFGTAEDIGAKEQVIMRLLAEHEGAITYINVRVAARATYRATG